jgi:hypothetical protein
MRAVLEYNLNTEREEFNYAVNGVNWFLVCQRMDALLRAQIKHAQDDTPQAVIDALQKMRDELHITMSAHNLTLE